ncbi:MAG: hypothetical protein ABW328_11360 [Ilumatobacteraceae bacterium]
MLTDRGWAAMLCATALGTMPACRADPSAEPSSTVPDATSMLPDAASTTGPGTSSAPDDGTAMTTHTVAPPSLEPATTAAALPPVATLVPEVPADRLTAAQLDPADPKNTRPVSADHVPVITSYLESVQIATKVSSTWPVDPDSPEYFSGPFSSDALESIRAAARERRERGEVLDVSQGVTFRPYMVGPVTNPTFVFDCEIAGFFWKHVDTGEPLPTNDIWFAGPGNIVEVGLRATLTFENGRWLLEWTEIYPAACG